MQSKKLTSNMNHKTASKPAPGGSNDKANGRNLPLLSNQKNKPKSLLITSASPRPLLTRKMPKRPSYLNPSYTHERERGRMHARANANANANVNANVNVAACEEHMMFQEVEKKKKLHHAPSWSVASQTSSLPSVPFLHMPSPTCAIFRNIKDPRIIADAIVKAVTSLSSVGNYNDRFASAIIYSMTNMKFSIQMYKHSSNKDIHIGGTGTGIGIGTSSKNLHSPSSTCIPDDQQNDPSPGGIMVEFDRLQGDTIEYHRTIQSITSTVKRIVHGTKEGYGTEKELGRKMRTLSVPRPTLSSTSYRPLLQKANMAPVRRSMSRVLVVEDGSFHGDNEDSRSNDIFLGAMQNIDTLIHKDRLDAVELGMQSLALLTSSSASTSSSAEDVAVLASKSILMDGSGTWQDVRNFILGIVLDDSSSHVNDEEESSDDESGYGYGYGCGLSSTSAMVERDCKLRLALTILANALSTALKHEKEFVPFMEKDELQQILTTMTKYMKRMTMAADSGNLHVHVHVQPQQLQIACQAARCISFLIQMTHELKVAALDLGIAKLAQDGVSIGSCHHAMVGNLSKDILSSLSGISTRNSESCSTVVL